LAKTRIILLIKIGFKNGGTNYCMKNGFLRAYNYFLSLGPLFFLFSMASFSPMARAATVDDFAALYLSPSEAQAANITEFASSGTAYYAVSVGATDVLLLVSDGAGGFETIANASDLEPVLRDYIPIRYGLSLDDAQIDAVNAEFDRIKNVSDTCVGEMDLVCNNNILIYWTLSGYDRGKVPLYTPAYNRITGYYASINETLKTVSNRDELINLSGMRKKSVGTLAVVAGGMMALDANVSALSKQKTSAELDAKITGIKKAISELKPVADAFGADYRLLYTLMPNTFNKIVCTLGAANYTALEGLLSPSTAPPTEVELAARLENSTRARLETYEIRKMGASASAKVGQAQAKFNALREKMALAWLETAPLDFKMRVLNSSAADVGFATSLSEAANASVSFEAELANATAFMDFVGSEQVFNALNDSNAVLNGAQTAIDEASTRMDPEDAYLLSVKDDFSQLKVSLEQAKSDMAQGLFEGKVEQISNITSELKLVQMRAGGMQPGAGQMDLLIIGGVALAVVVLVLAGYYFKGRRPPTAVEPAFKPPSGIIIQKPVIPTPLVAPAPAAQPAQSKPAAG
jgi:hypothetical protein